MVLLPYIYANSSKENLHVNLYNLRSARDDMLLNYPVCRTKITLGDRAFEFAAPKLCNALPLNIRKSTSLTVFKQLLKTHFFCMAFY